MGSLTLEIIIILALVMINGFFALAEIAVVSSRKSRLRQEAAGGSNNARAAVALADEPSTFLSSVQVGITLIGIIAGAFGGATLARELADLFEQVSWLSRYADTLGLVIVVAFIMFLSVVLGELVPKQLALSNPEHYAKIVARPMRFVAKAASPLVKLLGGTSRIVLTSLGLARQQESMVTDEEVTLLVEEGVQSGAFEKVEREIVERALRLDDIKVDAWMTPRVDIVWLDKDGSAEEIRDTISESQFTVYPVCDGSVDRITGMVYAHDVYEQILKGSPPLVPEIVLPALVIPSGTRVLRAVDVLRRSGNHVAVIKNEYGETEGIFTATDILQSLIGTIPVQGEQSVVRREDGSLLVDGSLPVDELENALDEDVMPPEESGLYYTVAGFVLHHLGRVPVTGDYFCWSHYRIEVVDMDGSRVDRILIQHNPDCLSEAEK